MNVWIQQYEDKVYIEEYHVGDSNFEFTSETSLEDVASNPDAGVPLYFFGTETIINIGVTNEGPRELAMLSVRSEAFVLHTDGTSGDSFGNLQVNDIEAHLYETVNIDASFTTEDTTLDSGLDRLAISVSSGDGNVCPIVTTEHEAIFCPPEYVENLIDELSGA